MESLGGMPKLRDAIVSCMDVGSEAGWATFDPLLKSWSVGTTATGCLASLAEPLRSGRVCIIGFEASGFLPHETDFDNLFRARQGPRGEVFAGQVRPWSIAAGKAATWAALPLVPAFLSALRQFVPADSSGTTRFDELTPSTQLIIYEAMVTSAPNGHDPPAIPEFVGEATSHIWDATVAVEEMRKQLRSTQMASAINEDASISFFGSALLASKWSIDPTLAGEPVFVVRAFKPQPGP